MGEKETQGHPRGRQDLREDVLKRRTRFLGCHRDRRAPEGVLKALKTP